ncbi:hypothetical protein [Novipirellula maiorica]|uniref:hypothetical protein n=1 Tax=Novipirellula maiorica TaxID=1265734 RepID=UPI0011817796|nr:hypothetical protein [Rhodopirellula maiorica]
MLTASSTEILGSLAFGMLVAVTTHVVYLLRTRRDKVGRLRGRFASTCIGVGTFAGMIVTINTRPGFTTLPVFGGMFLGWYVARRMGMLNTTHETIASETGHVMDPHNPYSPPGVLTKIDGNQSGEQADASESPN